MRMEKGLKKVPGVTDASVNFATEEATVSYERAQTGVEQMEKKVEAVGYKAAQQTLLENGTATVAGALVPPASSLLQEDEQSKRRRAEITRKRNLLILGIVLTLPVVILSMFFLNRFPGDNLLLLVLPTPIWAVVGWE